MTPVVTNLLILERREVRSRNRLVEVESMSTPVGLQRKDSDDDLNHHASDVPTDIGLSPKGSSEDPMKRTRYIQYSLDHMTVL